MMARASSISSGLRIWLADLTHTGVNGQSLGVDTFPLAIGCIATYTENKISLKNPLRLFRYPEKLGRQLTKEGCPDIIGFSNFIWNLELSLAVARRIKEMNPKTVVIMGGPNFPIEPSKQEVFLKSHPEVDFTVLHEGEAAFVNLLNCLCDNELSAEKVKGLGGLPSVVAVDKRGKFISGKGLVKRILDLDSIPSPYLTGKFDEFFDGRLWPLFQTKRGCPFTCTYCTEGSGYYSSVAKYSQDRISAEIDFIGKKMSAVRAKGGRCDLYIGDSNFGMYEEDIATAKSLARSYKLTGWPDHINTSTGKNQKERILEVARIVDGRIVLSGSVQTLDPAVLENIKRKNIAVDELMFLADKARDVDANSYCEVILGLPGETKLSHFQTLRTVVTAGFNKVIPDQLMILSGSELATEETLAKYGMELRSRVLPRAFGSYSVGDKRIAVADIEDICVATRSMSFEDYVACRIMHLAITIFYNDIVFGTVLKALRMNGLSIFRWLELILEAMPGTPFEELFDDFRRHTETELWKNRNDLEAFVRQPGTIDRYAKGELGFNLLYTFKARALILYAQGMADIVKSAVVRLCKKEDVETPGLSGFFDDVIRWDTARMKDMLDNIDHGISESFSYDIFQFSADDVPKELDGYLCSAPVVWHFDLTEGQKDYVRRNLKIFGEDATGIGRILSNSHTKQLLRCPSSECKIIT
jgi:radical SAM superfamily enzyme YgiQ (UPF0313 family)